MTIQGGSAAAPSLTFSGDTNTGIFSPAADTIAFSEGGVESMRIDSSGNVGIGTATPTSFGATSKTLQVSSANTGYGTVLVDSNGTAIGQFFASTDGTPYVMVGARSNHALLLSTNNTERARITSGGHFCVGTTAAAETAFQATFYGSVNGGFNLQNSTNFTSISVSGNDLFLDVGRGGTAGATIFRRSSSNTESARITTGGEWLVGKTTTADTTVGSVMQPTGRLAGSMAASTNLAADTLTVYSTGAGAYRFYVGLGGTVFATSTTISGISDARLKENIRDLDDGLEKVMALQPRKFDWKEGKGKGIANDRGFIAQEFGTVFPDMIEEWKDPAPEGEEPYKSVNANLIPTLVKAIQEQQQMIETLQAEVALLKGAA
jgi:hypothetical protein